MKLLKGKSDLLWFNEWARQCLTATESPVCRYLTAAVSPNMEVANAILPAYVISMLYFVGLLLRVPSMPHYWRWFIWVNPVSRIVHQKLLSSHSLHFFVALKSP